MRKSVTVKNITLSDSGNSYLMRFNTIAYCILIAILTALIYFDISKITAGFQSWPTKYFAYTLLYVSLIGTGIIFGFMYVYKLTPDDINKRLGLIKDITYDASLDLNKKPSYVTDDVSLSTQINSDSFDCRSKWPKAISAVRDQGACGSCCVFASTSMLSDRWAIHHSIPATSLSPQFLLDCKFDQDVCRTGSGFNENIKYLTKSDQQGGTVTELCYPYTELWWCFESQMAQHKLSITCITLFSTCVFCLLIKIGSQIIFKQNSKLNNVMTILSLLFFAAFVISLIVFFVLPVILNSTAEDTHSCRNTCRDASPIIPVEWFDDAYFVTEDSQSADDKINSIKTELVNRGPVLVGVAIPADFPRGFQMSVYRPQSWPASINHSMTIVGWKSDAWIVRNQWGTNWGIITDRGYYTHQMKTCFIEDYVVAGVIKD
ncbi:MAG: hypothetical protein EOP45_14605 [Sphingobacteriaceae bacterium]|nr:MAG: hypothetical protein EOP45_14605 [Sphingobacteriaceae bacterium]